MYSLSLGSVIYRIIKTSDGMINIGGYDDPSNASSHEKTNARRFIILTHSNLHVASVLSQKKGDIDFIVSRSRESITRRQYGGVEEMTSIAGALRQSQGPPGVTDNLGVSQA